MRLLFALSVSMILAVVASTATATPHVHAGDVFLRVVDNRIATGIFDEDHDDFDPARVFGSEFGEDFPNFTDEPGFDSEDGTFLPGSEIGFNILGPLLKWSGSDFSIIPPETLLITKGPLSVETGPGFVAGFFLPVHSDGDWHEHYNFTLQSPASDGIYALELQLLSTDPNVGPSLPFWFVFNQNTDDAIHDEAIEFLEQSLAVPEPTTAVASMLALGALGGFGLRRRRKA